MHSYYRVVNDGKEGATGNGLYNPLDLFSGEERRVKIAVEALWDTWCRSRGDKLVNNLKVFFIVLLKNLSVSNSCSIIFDCLGVRFDSF